MVAQRQNDWLSQEDFLALDRESWDQKYEYYHGRMYAMAGGSTSHSIIQSNANFLLKSHLRGKGCIVFTSDMTLKLKDACSLPDVSVTCNPKDTREVKNYIEFPCLVIEVLSSSTEKGDRGRKFFAYQECPSIQEYVLISQDKQLVEVFTRKSTVWIYHVYKENDIITLESVNITFPIEMLYEDVVFSGTENDV
jgi:Uma2 family endonuclease